jgi:hypothetical protein
MPVQAQNAVTTVTINQRNLSCFITAPPSRGFPAAHHSRPPGDDSEVPGMNDQALSTSEKTCFPTICYLKPKQVLIRAKSEFATGREQQTCAGEGFLHHQ